MSVVLILNYLYAAHNSSICDVSFCTMIEERAFAYRVPFEIILQIEIYRYKVAVPSKIILLVRDTSNEIHALGRNFSFPAQNYLATTAGNCAREGKSHCRG